MVLATNGSTLAAGPIGRDTRTVDEIMSTSVATIRDHDPLWSAVEQFHVGGLRHLVVLSDDGTFVGVLSDRLAVDNCEYGKREMQLSVVRDAIFDHRTYVAAGTGLLAAAHEILRHSGGALAVVDDDLSVVGIVTGADLLRAFVDPPAGL